MLMILGSQVSVSVPLVTLIVYLMVLPFFWPFATQLTGDAGRTDQPGSLFRVMPVPATKVHPLVLICQGTARAADSPVRTIGSSLTQILKAPDAGPHCHAGVGGFAVDAMT